MSGDILPVEMIRGYNHMSFLENLKIMLVAGVEGKRITFCLIDTQIVDESFLRISIFWTQASAEFILTKEYNKICEDIRPAVKHLGLETRDELKSFCRSCTSQSTHYLMP